ncbi:MAG: hypothetical protein WEC75_07450 [Dehalococcoidia bacterium]
MQDVSTDPVRRAMRTSANADQDKAPGLGWKEFILLYDVLMLGALAALAMMYFKWPEFNDLFPDPLRDLPLYAVWFGALGGVSISMKGIYDHYADWKHRYDLWHLGRPFSGAVVGAVTLILLQAVDENATPRLPIVLAAAYVLGTQERRFFEFLMQVGKVIVAVPGDSTKNNGPEQPPSP